MENALLVGLSRLVALERQFDVVANNIANINTTGFKSSSSIFQEYLASGARENEFAPNDAGVRFVFDRASFLDLRQGPVQQTGNPLDVAIDGDAFIAVQTAAGERYTRSGALKLNSAGVVVTADGTPVAGESGPITLQQNDRDISISADGRISVVEGATGSIDTVRGKLKLVTFAQPQQLTTEGASLFAAPAGVAPQAAPASVRVIHGATEGSNVNGVVEMSRMIEINRTYSMIAGLLQTQNDLHNSSIDKLAEVPT
jgi:flagellar basal-body rod protein FlgF